MQGNCSSAAVLQSHNSERDAPLPHLWTQVSKGSGIGSAQKYCVTCAAASASAAAAAQQGMKQAPGGSKGRCCEGVVCSTAGKEPSGAPCGWSWQPTYQAPSSARHQLHTNRSMAGTPWGPDQRAGPKAHQGCTNAPQPQIHALPSQPGKKSSRKRQVPCWRAQAHPDME